MMLLAWCGGAPGRAAATAIVDLTEFELEVLPAWLKGFQICNGKSGGAGGPCIPVEGAFRQKLGGPQAPYGTADVIHLLSTVNQLNFSQPQRDSWAFVLARYQNLSIVCNSPNSCKDESCKDESYPRMKSCPGLADGSVWPGFYTLEGSSGGWEPWHSSGDITASFRLLGRAPVHLNTMYTTIAANRSLWEPTFDPIVYGGIHKIIGILGTLLMQRPNATAEHAPFLEWFVQYINAHEQPSTGFVCDVPPLAHRCKCAATGCTNSTGCAATALHGCVAPSFATNMIKHVGLDAGWPLNRTAQRTILDLQLPTGFWTDVNVSRPGHTGPGYHDVDALFIAVRTLPWNPDRRPEVEQACAAFLRAVTTFGDAGPGTGRGLNDRGLIVQMYQNTHDLAGAIYGVALCQEEFPYLLITTRPWSFSGDRAPFI